MRSTATAGLLEFAQAALSSWPTREPGQADLRSAYLQQLAASPDALWRDGPPEHLTASAHVVDVSRTHVLLTYHRKGRFWVQPGGHLEPDDTTLAAAALREASEETGVLGLSVVGPADLHRHSLSSAFGRCREHLDAAYLILAPTGARPVVSDESLDVRWWPIDDLPSDVVPDLPQRLAAVRRMSVD